MSEVTPAVLAAAEQVEHDLGHLDVSTRALLTLLRAGQPPAGGGGGPAEYGIASFSTDSEPTGSTSRHRGWEFTVGASDLTLTGLRADMAGNAACTLNLYRVSDGVRLATVGITAVEGSWVEGSVTPVTLASGVNYVVSVEYSTSELRQVLSASVTFNSAITYVTGRFGVPGGMPASVLAGYLWGLPDIVFTT